MADYLRWVRALHLRLISADPTRPEVAELVEQLRAAGHLVITGSTEQLPSGVPRVPDFFLTEGPALPGAESLEAAEARHIAAVLRFTHRNKRQTALLLGVARSTLLAKIRRYGL